MDFRRFAYMSWAKQHYFDTEYSLVPSGMSWPQRDELEIPAVEPFHEVMYGDPGGLDEAISEAYGVPQEQILACLGSTQAYAHAFSVLLEPGDEILVEEPAYEVFACLATTQALRTRSFRRRAEMDFDLEITGIEEALSPQTKLIVLTSVHNPSGRLAPVSVLRALGELCETRGIHALVSEGYLDYVEGSTVGAQGEAPTRPYAHAIHPRLLSTNSMTKVYGLGSVRTGWLLGAPDLVAAMRELREILCPLLPALPSMVTVAALAQRHSLLRKARQRAARGRSILHEYLDDAAGLRLAAPQAGIMALVQLEGHSSSEDFVQHLRTEHGVGVVPAEFFGAPGWMRVGYGVDEVVLRTGLDRLRSAAQQYRGS